MMMRIPRVSSRLDLQTEMALSTTQTDAVSAAVVIVVVAHRRRHAIVVVRNAGHGYCIREEGEGTVPSRALTRRRLVSHVSEYLRHAAWRRPPRAALLPPHAAVVLVIERIHPALWYLQLLQLLRLRRAKHAYDARARDVRTSFGLISLARVAAIILGTVHLEV
jgi:hypothetical protein